MEQKRIEEIRRAMDYAPANNRDEDAQDIVDECLTENEHLQKERDAAIRDMPKNSKTCGAMVLKRGHCIYIPCTGCDKWQWRGLED